MSLREAIGLATQGREVPGDVIAAAFTTICAGEASEVEIAALLVALRTRGETVGEIVVRSEANMLRYWNQPEMTAQTVRDGWMWTGDAATWDEDGFVYIVDRKKEMIISGGENIYPAQVEQVLYRHPSVLAAAVVGIPDDEWGEAVHAEVVLKPGETEPPDSIQHAWESARLSSRRMLEAMAPGVKGWEVDLHAVDRESH